MKDNADENRAHEKMLVQSITRSNWCRLGKKYEQYKWNIYHPNKIISDTFLGSADTCFDTCRRSCDENKKNGRDLLSLLKSFVQLFITRVTVGILLRWMRLINLHKRLVKCKNIPLDD